VRQNKVGPTAGGWQRLEIPCAVFTG